MNQEFLNRVFRFLGKYPWKNDHDAIRGLIKSMIGPHQKYLIEKLEELKTKNNHRPVSIAIHWNFIKLKPNGLPIFKGLTLTTFNNPRCPDNQHRVYNAVSIGDQLISEFQDKYYILDQFPEAIINNSYFPATETMFLVNGL